MITQTSKEQLNNVIKDWRGNIVAFSIDMLKSSALEDEKEVTKFSINLSDRVALCEHNYESLELLKKHSRNAHTQLTEKMIKDSPLSWAWQFAKELEL